MKFDLQGIGNERDFVDPSIKQVSILDQVEITQVFHREGLLLCITKDKFKILVWNPYLGANKVDPAKKHLPKEEKLAVLHVSWVNAHAVEIWVTNKIDPGAVSWIKFVKSISVFVDDLAGNFFITRKSKLLWVTI
ncbi:F-box/kelch-repeat protein At3g13680-like [Brassica rapa]|uniref:F-box/kelch-repeat protein At3g13680-like n=1 Tax=Brassica campestris TaxID=3711 RepID=UPI00142DABC4|nr:F-box/kelch-repeat protein At3g13680-like [Brassica rapa]